MLVVSCYWARTWNSAKTFCGVPEVWIYTNHQLTIYILQANGYLEAEISPTFPNFPITELIPQSVQKAINDGTSQMLQELRALLRE